MLNFLFIKNKLTIYCINNTVRIPFKYSLLNEFNTLSFFFTRYIQFLNIEIKEQFTKLDEK